jgi:hypothetical protein
MTRLLTNQEVYHDLRTVGFYNDAGGGSTTLAAGASFGDITITLAAASTFANGDVIRVGALSNTVDIAIIASGGGTTTLTLKQPIAFAQANGSAVEELAFTDMGATTDAGVSFETTQDETPLAAGTQIATYLYLPGATEQQVTFAMLNFNAENLAQAFGIDETDSNYVTSSPEGIVLNQNVFASLGVKAWKFEGIREDAKTVIMHVYAAKVSATNVTIPMSTGTASEIPFALRSTGAVSIKYE